MRTRLFTFIIALFLICGFTVTPVVGAELTKTDFPCGNVSTFWDCDVFTYSENRIIFGQSHVTLCLDQEIDKKCDQVLKSKNKEAITISGKDVLAYLKGNITDAIVQESSATNGMVVSWEEICAFLENNPDIKYIMLADEPYYAAITLTVSVIGAITTIPAVENAHIFAADINRILPFPDKSTIVLKRWYNA